MPGYCLRRKRGVSRLLVAGSKFRQPMAKKHQPGWNCALPTLPSDCRAVHLALYRGDCSEISIIFESGQQSVPPFPLAMDNCEVDSPVAGRTVKNVTEAHVKYKDISSGKDCVVAGDLRQLVLPV